VFRKLAANARMKSPADSGATLLIETNGAQGVVGGGGPRRGKNQRRKSSPRN